MKSKKNYAARMRTLQEKQAILDERNTKRQEIKDAINRDKISLPEGEHELMTFASEQCSFCFGYGQIRTGFNKANLCKCVLKQVFRLCYRKYFECDVANPRLRVGVIGSALSCSFPSSEYRADFWLACFKSCVSPEQQLLVLHYYFHHSPYDQVIPIIGKAIGDPDYKRGEFFHAVYRTESRLGRALLDLGLFPFQKYFATKTGKMRICPKGLGGSRWGDPWLNGGNYWDAVPHMPVDAHYPASWRGTGVVVRKQNKRGQMVSAELPEDIQRALDHTI